MINNAIKHACEVLIALTLLAAQSVFAAEPLAISHARVRASAPGQSVGAAYMDIVSASDATLVKIESPVADDVEIHSMSMNNGVMKMRMLETLALPAGKPIRLAPGALHLMLIDLKNPLRAGERVSFAITIKPRSGKKLTQRISVPVTAETD